MNVLWTRFAVSITPMDTITARLYIFVDHVAALAVLSTILLAMLLYYIYQIQCLWCALDSPAYGEIPSALGLWGKAYYCLHRLMRGQRVQVLQAE